MADTLAKHAAVVGMHGDVVTRSNDVTTKHTQINGWRATIEAQHTAVNGWHSAVSGWRNEVATWHPQVQGWRNEVSTWRGEVSTWRGEVLSAQTDVSAKRTEVSGWHGQVSTWQAQVAANRALAEAWANNAEDLPISGVTPTAYSAKHWALKAQAIAGGTAPNSLQLVGIPGANFYHTGNKPTPEAIGALPTSGVAADATKLGNKLASEYALKTDLAALVGNEFDLYSETRTADALYRLRVNAGSSQFDFTPYYGGSYRYTKQLYFDVTNQRWAFDETPYVGNNAMFHAGNLPTALATARTIAMTGDGSWSVSFNGAGNVTATMTLANSGVTAGTYGKVTVDAKGRVTAGSALAASDIPALDASKVTAGAFADARIPSLAASKVSSGIFDPARLPDATPSAKGAMSAADKIKANNLANVVWSGSANGSVSITLANGLYAVDAYIGDGGGYKGTFLIAINSADSPIAKSCTYYENGGYWSHFVYNAGVLSYIGTNATRTIYRITRIY
ncbi:MAG: hypothetical protein II007_13370 [Gammaproteobacteria bacterium]|nr:hypothetical protein [Gammaproteobacteria bacterium]